MNKITTIAIDLAKNVFQVAGEDELGREQFQKRLKSRQAFSRYLLELEAPLGVVMEVGPGAQAWARQLQAQGLTVRLLPAAGVAQHRSGAKNDANDARAILRAARDSSVHAVPIKTTEQLAMQALHRAREGWTRRRTSIANQMRGLLTEHGLAFAKGDAALDHGLDRAMADQALPIPPRLVALLELLRQEWRELAGKLSRMDAELKRLAVEDPIACRIDTVRGIGPIGATALACKIADLSRYGHCRRFAASFGIVPEQHSSGDRQRLGRMSKRGDRYIRSLLINGAHAVIRALPRRPDDHSRDTERLRRWQVRCGTKGAAIRLANHNLREVYALLTRGEDHRME